jgi:2-dehydropantoate 2-reductase
VVGEIDGAPRERTRAMHELLKLFEPDAVLTDNIWGYPVGQARLRRNAVCDRAEQRLRCRRTSPTRSASRWFDTLGARSIAVAQAARHRAGRFPRVRPGSVRARRREAARRAAIESLRSTPAIGAKTHSGVWRDLAVRKRKTEVDHRSRSSARSHARPASATPGSTARRLDPRRRGRPPALSFATFQELIDTCTSARTAASRS